MAKRLYKKPHPETVTREFTYSEWERKALGVVKDGYRLIEIRENPADAHVTEVWQKWTLQ